MLERQRWKVPQELDGLRLDIALRDAPLGLSRRKIRRIIDLGGAYINRKRVRIASRVVNCGDNIELSYQSDLNKIAQLEVIGLPLEASEVLFQNDDIIAINKRPGLPSQATREQSQFHAGKLLHDFLGTNKPPILVHRLDKETSGVLLFARNADSAAHLNELFRERRIEKTYWAFVVGCPQDDEFEVTCHLSPIHKQTGIVDVVRSGGKWSRTEFRVLKAFSNKNISLVEAYPKTGRGHQIRVHLLDYGNPILGDKRYGDVPRYASNELAQILSEHHLLHAREVVIPFDSSAGEVITVTAPAPANFAKVERLASDDAK